MIPIGILILGYTGFPTAQDIAAIWRTGRAQPYVETPPYAEGPEPYDPSRPYNPNDTGAN
jgi:hypothetical protein